MQRVRIKKAPQLGEQVDYSFYDSRYRNMGMGGSSESDVKNTMGPVPREEANIEVELGEVVVGDTNQDGYLELFTFTGKPHSKGGTPVNIPPGSFIFSNTKKLFIKDETLLKELFGLPPRKGGYSPAEIAKKYQINEYVEKVRNADSDALTKRTAQTVLDKNLEKLGELALVQESMKGFPDGIPSIAMIAAQKMGLTSDSLKEMQGQGQPQQEQQMPPQGSQEEMMEPQQEPMTEEMMQGMMRRGGRVLKRYQDGKQTEIPYSPPSSYFENILQDPRLESVYQPGPFGGDFLSTKTIDFTGPVKSPSREQGYLAPGKDYTFFSNDFEPVTVEDVDYSRVPFSRDSFREPYIRLSDGTVLSQEQYMYLMASGSNQFSSPKLSEADVRAVNKKMRNASNNVITTMPVVRTRTLEDSKGNPTSLSLSTGDKLEYDGKIYKVVNPFGEYGNRYKGSWQKLRDTFDNTHGSILVQDDAGKYSFIEGEDLAETFGVFPGSVVITPREYLDETLKNLNKGVVNTKAPDNDSVSGSMESSLTGTNQGGNMHPDSIKQALRDDSLQYVIDTKNNKEIGITQKPLEVEEKGKGKKKNVDEGIKVVTPPKKKSIFEEELRFGGSILPKYQGLQTSTVTQPLTTNTTAPDPNAERVIKTVKNTDGSTVVISIDPKTKEAIYRNEKGEEIPGKRRPLNKNEIATYVEGDFSQYGPQAVQDILKKNPNVKYTTTNFGNFGNQPRLGTSGIYLASGSAKNRQTGTLTDEEWADFYDRHGDWIETEYPGGFNKFKQDITTGVDPIKNGETITGHKASQWFQDKVNEYTNKEFGTEYFDTKSTDQKNPYKRDTKFGQFTYSVPRFFKLAETPTIPPKETPEEKPEPGKKLAYYCVELEDGSKSVQTVEYAEGTQPTAPTGKSVTQYDSRGAADAGCTSIAKITNTPRKFPYTTEWDIKDLTNFMGTITDRPVNRQSMLTQVPDVSMGYVLQDPTYESERVRSAKASQDALLASMLSPQVAAAVMASNAGDYLDKESEIISRITGNNAQTVNQALGVNSQLQAGVNAQNAQFLDKFRTNTLANIIGNARGKSEDKWREIEAFNRGIKGVQNINALRRMYPNSAADQTYNMTGFAGAPDASIFGPAMMSSTNSGVNATANIEAAAMAAAVQARKEAIDAGMSSDAAEKFGLEAYRRTLNNSSPRGNSQTAYANSIMSGNNNYAPEFGAFNPNILDQP
jgi:hypothetical protein